MSKPKNAFENEAYYDEVIGRRATPWSRRALEILQDGEWHDREEIIRELADMVPPGVAWRHLEKGRIAQLYRKAQDELGPEAADKWKAEQKERPQPADPTSTQIRKGQRAVVITQLGGSARIIREKRDGKVYLMRIPISDRLLNSGVNQIRTWGEENGG